VVNSMQFLIHMSLKRHEKENKFKRLVAYTYYLESVIDNKNEDRKEAGDYYGRC
jgi:hypothetical protein